jgi:thioredoxin-related protein
MTAAARLPMPDSLAQAARTARPGEPLVLMFSVPNCPWCLIWRRNYLAPMRRDEGLAAFELDFTSRKPILGFRDEPSSAYALARDLGVRTSPTLAFFDPSKATEAAPRVAGVASVDMMGDVLAEALKAARIAIRNA